jgi:hypothetical protein
MNKSTKVGRKPVPVSYKKVKYIDKYYYIGHIKSKNGLFRFIIDDEDSKNVMERSWHISSAGYVVSYYSTEDKINQLLLHNFVMNRLTFPGRGAAETIDHINRNPLDNRKENLRVVSQTEQNINQKKKVRSIVQLPEGCGIEPDDIPRHIWYVKANGAHGDRFAIELKTENIVWKTSSSKKLTLLEKLSQANEKLAEFYEKYHYLNPASNNVVDQAEELNKSFNEILELANLN